MGLRAPPPQPRPSRKPLPDSGHSVARSLLPCTRSTHCGGRRPLSRTWSSHTLQKGCCGGGPDPSRLPELPPDAALPHPRSLTRPEGSSPTPPPGAPAARAPSRRARPTGAVAGHQGVAEEARGAALAAGAAGVAQAAPAGAGQGVAVAEEQVGVTVAAAVAGLAGAAQHQWVPEEARRAPGVGGEGRVRGLGCSAHSAHLPAGPRTSAPSGPPTGPPARSPLAGGARVARLAETLCASSSQDAAHGKAADRDGSRAAAHRGAGAGGAPGQPAPAALASGGSAGSAR